MWLPRERILVPLDFSEESGQALGVAIDIAGPGGQVTGVHVLPDLSPVEPGQLWDTVRPEMRIEHAGAALHKWLKERGMELDNVEVCIGDPGAEICRIATHRDADLIVLSSHGRTGLKRLLIGSVAERVVRLAHCPVLVLRHFEQPTPPSENHE